MRLSILLFFLAACVPGLWCQASQLAELPTCAVCRTYLEGISLLLTSHPSCSALRKQLGIQYAQLPTRLVSAQMPRYKKLRRLALKDSVQSKKLSVSLLVHLPRCKF